MQGVRFKIVTEGTQLADKVIQQLDELKAKASGAAPALAQTSKAAVDTGAKLGNDLAQGASKASAGIAGLSTSFKSLLQGAGITLSIAGVFQLAKAAVESATALLHMSQRLGVSVEDLSVFQFAAKRAGGSIEDFTSAFRTMDRVVMQALSNDANARALFERLGVSVDDLKHKDPKSLFLEIVSALDKITDATTRGATAQEIFGRGGLQLMPILHQLAGDGFAKLNEEAEKWGAKVSTEVAEHMNNLENAFSGAKSSVLSFTATLLDKMLPTMEGGIDVIKRFWESLANPNIRAGETTGGIGSLFEDLKKRWEERFGTSKPSSSAGMVATPLGYLPPEALAVPTNRTGFPDPTAQLKALQDINSYKARELELQKQIFDLTAGSAAAAVRGEEVRYAQARLTFETAIAKAKAENNAQAIVELQHLEQLEMQFHDDKMTRLQHELDIQRNWIEMPDMRKQIDAQAAYQKEVDAEIAKYNQDVQEKVNTYLADQWLQKFKENQLKLVEELNRGMIKVSLTVAEMITATIRSVARGAATAFIDIATGHSVRDAFAAFAADITQSLADSIGQAMKNWMKSLESRALGTPVKDAQGNVIGYTGGSAGATATLAAIQGVGTAYQLYQNGQQGVSRGQNALAGAAAGAAIGTQIYPGVGTVIGAVVGAIAGWLTGSSGSKAPQGMPGFSGGAAHLGMTSHMTQADIDSFLADAQTQAEKFFNGYINILLKLPGAALQNISKIGIGGLIGDQKYLQEWLQQILPAEIANQFFLAMKSAFTSAGLTSDQFVKFVEETSRLKPEQALQFWSDLADGLASFASARQRLASIAGLDNLAGARLGANGLNARPGDSDFVTNLRQGTQSIFDQARAMVSLTGSDRVAAFKALGASVDQVTKSLADYINRIGQVLRNLKTTFDDARLQMKIDQLGRDAQGNPITPDKNAEARLLEDAYNQVIYQIQHAAQLGLSPEDVQALTQKGLGLLGQLYDLDPSKAAYDWWLQQVDVLQKMSTDSLNTLAQAASSAVDKLLTELQPFVDWFNGLPVDLDAAIRLITDDAFPGFEQAINDLANRIRNIDLTPPGQTPPGGGPGNPNGPNNPQPHPPGENSMPIVVVNVNGSNYGVQELTENVAAAVTEMFRVNPRILRPTYGS